MKELWTANPFCLMNRPFAEMGYNSSGLNIAPKRLLLATRRPSMHPPRLLPEHHPSTLCAPPADAPQTMQHTAQHPPSRCVPSSDPCAASVGSLHAICPPVHRAIPASPSQAICRRSAQHLATPCKPSVIARHSIRRPPRVIRQHPAGNLLARTDALTARRTNRRRKQEP